MSPINTMVPADRLVAPHLSTGQHLVIQQTKVESQALEHVTQALEVAIAWVVDGDDISRKLSSVRFLTESYQRHFERLFALEEVDGYMESIAQLNPELASQVDGLKEEHEQFRDAIRKTVLRLDQASPVNPANFSVICEKLRTVINQIMQHIHQENELLVESVQQDTGGEG
jgi:Hemerythrin HHE cation binding domain